MGLLHFRASGARTLLESGPPATGACRDHARRQADGRCAIADRFAALDPCLALSAVRRTTCHPAKDRWRQTVNCRSLVRDRTMDKRRRAGILTLAQAHLERARTILGGRGTPSEPPMGAQRADSSTARCAMLAKRERWVDKITTERPAASAMANSVCWMNLAPQRFGVGQVPMSFGPVPRATRDVQPRAAGFWQRQSLPLIAPAPLCLRSSLWSARARECACASLKVAVIARTWRAGLSENRRPIFVPQTRAALFRKTI
jgi:hypothetical protein